jgi:hypothetical protein
MHPALLGSSTSLVCSRSRRIECLLLLIVQANMQASPRCERLQKAISSAREAERLEASEIFEHQVDICTH